MVSVIIPNYNRKKALLKTLKSLAGQTLPVAYFEVIVVDDGSTDETRPAVQAIHFPFEFKFVEQDNQGPGAARNLGASLANYDCLVFLDADMIPVSTLLEVYLNASKDFPETIFFGRQLPWAEAFTSPFEQVFNYVSFQDPGPKSLQPPFYYFASGNFAIHREQLKELNGFDEALIMTEDTDLAYRAHLAGISIAYLPDAVGYHNHSKTLNQLCAQTEVSAWWTAQLMKKHPGLRGQIPAYQVVEPVVAREDSAWLILQKIGQCLYTLKFLFWLFPAAIRLLELLTVNPRVLSYLYRQQLAGFRFIGFRRGWQASFLQI